MDERRYETVKCDEMKINFYVSFLLSALDVYAASLNVLNNFCGLKYFK